MRARIPAKYEIFRQTCHNPATGTIDYDSYHEECKIM